MAYPIKIPKVKEQKKIKNFFILKKQGYEDGEWANQFYVWHLKDGKNDVVVSYDALARTSPYSVTYGGAIDFIGNKRELLNRYPELKEYIRGR